MIMSLSRRVPLLPPLFVAATIFFSLTVFADESHKQVCVGKDCFSSAAMVGKERLPLLGATQFRYLFFHVYSIALYGPKGVNTSAGILSDIPKKLVLRYHHRFTRDQIVKGGDEMMRRNPEVNFASIADAVSQMATLYMESVHEEDEYAVVYQPGQGISLYFNGEFRGSVPGAEFARAYFGIWLSNASIDDEMRDALLGRNS
ncbi:MAG: hypothetical protein EB060_12375 [Proteobacteria bacterium]|nr:hypothetical protein [Pseudomonadota bacterium]